MIINKVENPTYPAPDGVLLGQAVQLNHTQFEKNNISIDCIYVLADLSFEITFSYFQFSWADNINGLADFWCDEQDLFTYIDENYETLEQATIAAMKDWAVDALESCGFPSDAIIGGPYVNMRDINKPVIMRMRFFGQPPATFDVIPSVSAAMNLDVGKRTININRMMVGLMLNYEDQDLPGANADDDPTSHQQFGDQIAWCFPWNMHWALPLAVCEFKKSDACEEDWLLRYDFSASRGLLYSKDRNANNLCPEWSLVDAWRPIIYCVDADEQSFRDQMS